MTTRRLGQQRVRKALVAAGLSLGLLAGHGALAEEGLYFGLTGGVAMPDLPSKSEFDQSLAGLSFTSELDDTSNAWGVAIGYRWNAYVAAEIGYVNFGKTRYEADFTGTNERLSLRFLSSGITASVLGMFPLTERFDIHGRVGLYSGDTKVRVRDEDFTTGDFVSAESQASSEELFAGLGATWNVNESFSLRVEYSRFFDVGDEDHTGTTFVGETDVDLIGFSVLFR